MPIVNVKIIEGVFDASQKQRIVRDVTEALINIEGENMREVTHVIVEEVLSGDWGIGGRPMTSEDVRALASGAAVG
jgi:4-oxalocrotonate tautomerase